MSIFGSHFLIDTQPSFTYNQSIEEALIRMYSGKWYQEKLLKHRCDCSRKALSWQSQGEQGRRQSETCMKGRKANQ